MYKINDFVPLYQAYSDIKCSYCETIIVGVPVVLPSCNWPCMEMDSEQCLWVC